MLCHVGRENPPKKGERSRRRRKEEEERVERGKGKVEDTCKYLTLGLFRELGICMDIRLRPPIGRERADGRGDFLPLQFIWSTLPILPIFPNYQFFLSNFNRARFNSFFFHLFPFSALSPIKTGVISSRRNTKKIGWKIDISPSLSFSCCYYLPSYIPI